MPRFLVSARPFLFTFVFALIALGFPMQAARAATQDGALRMEVITAYNFVVDSNIETPAGKSPSAAHLAVKVFNDGPTALTNVVVNIGKLTNPATSSGTSGLFASRTVDVTGQYAGTFALQMPGGASDAVRTISRIEPGKSVVQYFFVTYPLKDSLGRSVTGSAPDPNDDLWLNYDMWVSANDGGTIRRVEKTSKVTMRNEISAMANKIWPNTTSKVPTQYLSAIEAALGWRPDTGLARTPGASTAEGIWYDLGNVGAGFDNNGDGIPDRNAWLQPVGDPSQFSPLAARLVKCYGIVIVKLNNGTEQLIPFEDRLYFENLPANNTGAIGLVYYEFLPLNTALPNSLSPYQEVASGYDNEKFNGDYGTITGRVASQASVAQIVKTGPTTRVKGQAADYILTATNSGTTQFGWPDLGLPAVIEDLIPAGLEYLSGTANTLSNTTNPAGGGYSVYYSTDNGSTWSTTEPVPASAVNRLRWVLDRSLAPGDTATVVFSALVPTDFGGFNFTNTGVLKSGTETEVSRSTWPTTVAGINSIGDFIWRDLNRDGLQSGALEIGIPNIGVTLYVDVNGDGILNTGDVNYATTSTNGSGGYLFSDLPDGKYIIVVAAADPDVPTGFTLKAGTSDRFTVDLDSSASNPGAVNFLTADWPFIKALEVTKSVTPTSYLGGDLINYRVDLDNHMGTLQIPQQNVQTAYASSTAFDKSNAAGKATEAEAAGAPNNVFANIDWNANSDRLVSSGIIPAFTQISTISKVELVIRGYQSAPLINDQLDIQIGHATRPIALFQTRTTAQMNALVGVSQDLVIDITAAGTWTWAQAQSLTAALVSNKTGGGDSGDYNVDSIGFRITTANTPFVGTGGPNTIVQWPLVDTYDSNKLEFVSASVTPDITSPAGRLEWFNLGPVNAGARKTITVTFRAKTPTDTNNDGKRDPMVATNTVNTIGSTSGNIPIFQSGLPAGHGDNAVNVTINPAGRIGDFVYWDVDANGSFGTSDFPISRVIVQLFRDSGSGFVYTGRSQITDANGTYDFSGLVDGTYQIRITTDPTNDLFSLPWTTFTSLQKGTAGSNQTGYVQGDTVVLNNSDFLLSNDTNFLQDFSFDSNVASLISGKLFRDWNGNGVQDPGEEPLVGFSITLSGGSSRTTTTDANGFYQFTNVTVAGNHTVTITTPPSGHTQTLDPDATLNNATTINVVLGNAYSNRDFAYRPAGILTIGDTLYYDWNGNGVQNAGENGIANIEIRLYQDENGDGVNNITDALVATTSTNASGVYQFTGLAAGNYLVEVNTSDPDFPGDYIQTQDFDLLFDNSAKVNLVASLNTVDFGYQPIGTTSLGNLVWLDLNNNGLNDSGEPGLDGVVVQLYRSDQTPGVDAPSLSTVTSGGGLYSFSNLPAGSYYLYLPVSNFGSGQPLESYPWSSTISTITDNQVDNDDNGIQGSSGSGVTSPLITLGVAEIEQSVDFGFTGTGSAGDFVFYDGNGNGRQDFTEAGIPGVTVQIFLDADLDGLADSSSPIASTVTSDGSDSNPIGFYQFTGLFPATYFIQVDTATLPVGVIYTSDPDRDGIPVGQSPVDPIGDDGDSYVFIAIGAGYTGGDFGYQPPGAIGDFVWLDLDQDGVVDAGEPGLANVEIQITNGVTTFNVFTDPDGYWSAIVTDGSWTVTVLPSNFNGSGPLESLLQTYDADGTGTANATSLVVSGGAVTSPSALPDGNLGIDFGYRLNGVLGIAGTVLTNDTRAAGTADDIDNFADDGVDMDAGPLDETELEGVEVYLYASSGSFLGTTTTDASGNYSYSGLPAGTYLVIIGTTEVPLNTATLTTTATNNPAVSSVDSSSGTTVRQTVTIIDAFVNDVDYAFLSLVNFDFGDLPLSFNMTTLAQDGARHIIPGGGSTLWLGSAPDTEINGISNALAMGDDLVGSDDEDGVSPVAIDSWTDGTVGAGDGGVIQFSVNGTGWLVGWVDWNSDGDFLDASEFIVNRSVSTGLVSASFDIPAGTITGSSQSWLSRFRLLPEEPPFPLFSYIGEVVDGEVEDDLLEIQVGGSIGDLVWIDSNGDGVIDSLEVGFGGVLVELRDDLNQPITTLTTSDGTQDVDGDGVIDPVGYYRFRGLTEGTYTVVIPTPPAAYTPSYDEDGSNTPSSSTVVLVTGVQHLTADFGYEPLRASISGQVRFDADADSDLADTDTGVPNAIMQLWTDPNGDGDPSDGTQVDETNTDATGFYSFLDVPTGSYVVVEINLPDSTSTADVDGGNPDRIAVLIAGTDITGRDFLDTIPSGYPGSLTGHLYLDSNGNGTQDPGEPNLADVDILITDANNETQTVTSDSNGDWIATVPPGSTNIKVDENDPQYPTGYTQTQGDDPTIVVAVSAASIDGGIDGYYLPATIAGNVFEDIDGLDDNTVNGTGTNGGVIHVNLVNPADNTVIASIPVNPDGTYFFGPGEGVEPFSDYLLILTPVEVTVGNTLTSSTLPVPWISTGENLGATAGSDGLPNGILAVSTTGGALENANFGIDQRPDVTPVITAQPNVMNGPTDFNIRVQVVERHNVETEGSITIRIPKDTRWTLRTPYEPTLTILDGVAMNNNVWTYSQDETHHIFTTINSSVVIPAGGSSYFGIKARWESVNQQGVYTVTVQIDSGSGNESPINNNSDAEKIDFFDN